MARIANTFVTNEAVGIREDLSDIISNISPEDTPFMSNAGRGPKPKNTFFEWQQDSLAAVDGANAHPEGDDVSAYQAITPTVRIGNYVQISRKTIIISETEEAVDKAGRDDEEAYQRAKRSAELKRDMETILLSNQGADAATADTARKTGSLLAFVKTNVDKEATGTDPVYTNIPTDPRNDGVQRAFTVDQVKTVMQECWNEGGRPDTLMVGGHNKTVASGFAGVATKTWNMNGTGPAKIIGTADVYVSDFGTLHIVPNRFQRTRDAHLLDFSFIKLRYLRPYKIVPLAKTGDADKSMLRVEWGLQVVNEKALGLVADLTTS